MPPTTSSATPTSARSTTRSARTGRSAASAAPGGGGGGTFRMEDMGDLGDLFGGLFGVAPAAPARPSVARSAAPTWRPAAPVVPGRGPRRHDVGQRAPGGALLELPRQRGRPGTSTHTCPRCGGTGSLNDNQGLFSLSTVCPDCMGRGTLFDTPCPVCHGTGTEHKVRSVKVRIPAGVEDGQRIRVKGRGAPGQGMAPAGRPLRGRPRGQARDLRAQRAQPDHHGADHLPRGGAGDDHHGADARRQGHAEGAARHASGKVLRVRGRGVPAGPVATARSRATCWSRSRWWCRPSSPTSRRRRWSRWPR